MTIIQAISKCHKKAWQEIKAIQQASNMLEVEQAINDAVEKTFGIYNQGLLLVRMKRLGQMGELESQSIVRIRRQNFNNHCGTIRHYLDSMIPSRFFKTLMYQKYIGRLAA